jgi:aspartate/glutamate racemase
VEFLGVLASNTKKAKEAYKVLEDGATTHSALGGKLDLLAMDTLHIRLIIAHGQRGMALPLVHILDMQCTHMMQMQPKLAMIYSISTRCPYQETK